MRVDSKYNTQLLKYKAGYDHAEPERKKFLRNCCKAGLRIWPTSAAQRRSWLAQTIDLIDSGKHCLQTGGYKINQKEIA
jgi:hypothetical protein